MALELSKKVPDETLRDYHQLKMENKFDFQFIGIKEQKNMETVLAEPTTANLSSRERWEKMRKLLREDEAVYVIIPIEYELQTGGKRSKLLFISWVPKNCPKKDKMLSAACRSNLRKKLEGVDEHPIHATDVSQLDYDEILADVSKGQALME